MTREGLILGCLLAATFALRAAHPGQPITENYVGRQIPTAMVARNLERGGSFFRPQLDTGPFPNLFLVEPPIYAQVVAWARPALGFDRETTGRLVSAASTTLAAWGLFGLVRRREGLLASTFALASFGIFPVMIRYGRAFQPDALMLGCVLAGLRGWDEYNESGDRRWAAFGGFVFSAGLALKITAAWALIPFAMIVRRLPISRRVAAGLTMLVPAILWYLAIWPEVAQPTVGSLASADNAGLWLRSISPGNWLRLSTYEDLGLNLVVRSFTPIGFVLSAWGLTALSGLDRLWRGWAAGCALAILALAAKWHHAYYWMAVAPLMGVGIARGLVKLADQGRSGKIVAAGLGSSLLASCLIQSASTWRSPAEWASLSEASIELAKLTKQGEWVVAPEAVLYSADRRGYRLEFDPSARRRAAGEWGAGVRDLGGGLGLVEAYREIHTKEFGACRLVVADVGDSTADARRHAWREAIRARPATTLLADRPGYLIAELR